MLHGATQVLFEGTPTFPTPDRLWDICHRYKVTTLYTAPTALRVLMGLGNQHVEKHDLSGLRLLGTVGEPINPEAWKWYYEVVGKKKASIVDTLSVYFFQCPILNDWFLISWWQTETGGLFFVFSMYLLHSRTHTHSCYDISVPRMHSYEAWLCYVPVFRS